MGGRGETELSSDLGSLDREFLITDLLEPCRPLSGPRAVNHKEMEAGAAVAPNPLLLYCSPPPLPSLSNTPDTRLPHTPHVVPNFN